MTLKKLLYCDLQRQYKIKGLNNKQITFFTVLSNCVSPKFLPILLYRFSHSLYCLGVPALPQIFSLINFLIFGIEIAPKCQIGGGVFFPHTQGTVIGAWSIGDNATIFQGVTLGAKELDMRYLKDLRPILHNNVTVGAGAKVLGGVILNNNSKIGANAVVLKDVPDSVIAVGVPAIYK